MFVQTNLSRLDGRSKREMFYCVAIKKDTNKESEFGSKFKNNNKST